MLLGSKLEKNKNSLINEEEDSENEENEETESQI